MRRNIIQIDEIALLLKEVQTDLLRCARCGMCQGVCPVFYETRSETDVTRGKLVLLEGLIEKMFDNPEGVLKRLNRCLLCGSCALNCPNGVKAVEIFFKARLILSSVLGLSMLKRNILKKILANPDAFNRTIQLGIKFQKWAIKPESKILNTSSLRFSSHILADRHFVRLSPVPFHLRQSSIEKKSGSNGIKVLFFVGCLIDNIFPNVGEAVLKALNYHNMEVIIPEKQACCGIPMLSSGDAGSFEQLMQHNLKLFEEKNFDFIVSACATCTYTLKKIWPMMVQNKNNNIKSAVTRLSQKVQDISEFLVSKKEVARIPADFSNERRIITYHDPCHLKKSLNIYDEPRSIITANPEFKLVEMAGADQCCGMGVTFNLEHYDLSCDIGKRKVENIKAANCEVVATGCPACMIHLSDILSKSGLNISVKHPVEIYAEKWN